jgi:hypothetical protein
MFRAASVPCISCAQTSPVAVLGGGSPATGNLSADGKLLWLSGRYHGVIYAFNTDDRAVTTIPVGGMPHCPTDWPQPGRYSLGHTGNLR